jgi:deoxycytidylate deaminase
MTGLRLNRIYRHRGRALIVWAMMPLAIINGRTIVGCGCTGHFEEVCHCTSTGSHKTCCESTGSCCRGHSPKTCCCSAARSDSSAVRRTKLPTDATCHVGARPCVRVVAHVVVPATVGTTLSSGDQLALLDGSLLDLSFLPASTKVEPVVQLDLKCPSDLVVTLHRFLI